MRAIAPGVRKALEVEFTGADHFNIANADTVMEKAARADAERLPGRALKRRSSGPRPCVNDKARRVIGRAGIHLRKHGTRLLRVGGAAGALACASE